MPDTINQQNGTGNWTARFGYRCFRTTQNIHISKSKKHFIPTSPKHIRKQVSNIYFMAKEDIIIESLAAFKAEARQSLSITRFSEIVNDDPVTSQQASPRPILNKRGGGFRSKAFRNTITSLKDLDNPMLLNVKSGLEK
jgi:hypothetical protein